MLDNLVNRYTFYLFPGNILQAYYVKEGKEEGKYTLSDGLFENMMTNSNISDITKAIELDLGKYQKKGFEIRNKNYLNNDVDIKKLFKIKFLLSGNIEINKVVTNDFIYYVSDNTEYKDDKLHTHRNIIFFTKELTEYIGRFTITIIDDNPSIGSIFITTSKQRLGSFTKVVKNDLKNFLPKNNSQIDVFSILKKGLGFYKKIESEGYFKFTNGEVDGILYIK